MDSAPILAQLRDLPPTFTRPTLSYQQLNDATTFALAMFTQGCDATTSELAFWLARYGWLDVWGLLFGLPRFINEADSIYLMRIAFEVLAGAGPPKQIQNWVLTVYGLSVSVTENLPNVGYKLTFPATVSTAQITAILAGLAYVRPAGVPILGIYVLSSGTILETINFFDAPSVAGAYLSGGAVLTSVTLASSTNNAQPLLPSLFLTDPTLTAGAG